MHQLSSFTELRCHCLCLIKSLAAACLPRVCCHTLITDWLPAPLRTRHYSSDPGVASPSVSRFANLNSGISDQSAENQGFWLADHVVTLVLGLTNQRFAFYRFRSRNCRRVTCTSGTETTWTGSCPRSSRMAPRSSRYQGPIHTGCMQTQTQATGTCCCTQCLHWMQATSKELPANLCAHVQCELGLNSTCCSGLGIPD